MRYTFSKETVAEFYGRQFYSITNTDGKLCAYSEKVFDISKEITLHAGGKTLIFEKAILRGGEMRGGEIKVSMLQIQGTRHFCYASFTEDGKEVWLGIGCHFKPISVWIETYKSIGESEDYSTAEIEEYWDYIQMFARRYAPELLRKPVKKSAKK